MLRTQCGISGILEKVRYKCHFQVDFGLFGRRKILARPFLGLINRVLTSDVPILFQRTVFVSFTNVFELHAKLDLLVYVLCLWTFVGPTSSLMGLPYPSPLGLRASLAFALCVTLFLGDTELVYTVK